jgi:hypothetical protein
LRVATGLRLTNSWLATNSERVYETLTLASLLDAKPETSPLWMSSLLPPFSAL